MMQLSRLLSIVSMWMLLQALIMQSVHATTPHSSPEANQAAEADSIIFSLITCGQGEEIYALFGHTAIRYQHPAKQIDVVFNYGVFDFNTPHFALRFALGHTDYLLGINNFHHFCATYAMMERSVSELVLNLNSEEKARLLQLLEENYRPENRTYRYNFFYDNCATRPRNLIEQAITTGTLHYAETMNQPIDSISFRTLLHRYSTHALWSRFGMDLCMGSKADLPITRREMEFVPFCLRDDLRHAFIVTPDGKSKPLVIHELRWNNLPEMRQASDTHLANHFTPSRIALMLLMFVTALTIVGTLLRRHTLWFLDLATLLPAGLSGCILAFLAFFSQHPCVDSNLILLAFHPLHLFCLPCTLRRIRKGLMSRYQIINLCSLTLFIIVYFLKIQIIPATTVYLALCLLVRTLANIWLSQQKSIQLNLADKAKHV